ncbi:type II CAAX prenyl endopeptidase Rce1 family protein [Persicobacter psychrovividus]|uniref:CAAX prenyl protease 2/Lysostaphin resistance protein A-like domain-containing protein n=1 Tax=Persicobacter psychrovividus TaxID=387638 RepID=A0ABN6L4Q1_9BACT|nr:hypothetical protein PEPS_03610 [Persicobacter psychrovividus]
MDQVQQSKDFSLLNFWKEPRAVQEVEAPAQAKVTATLRTYLLMWIPMVVVMGIISLLESSGAISNLDKHAIEQLLHTYPLLLVFLFAGLIQPTLEEVAFRLFLRPKWADASLILWVTFMSGIMYQSIPKPYSFVIIGAFAVGLYLYFSDFRVRRNQLWEKHGNAIFWFSVISFGLAHMVNFIAVDIPIWAIPLMVLPQLVAGYFLGFVRLKFGIRYSILFHCLHNSLLLVGYFANEYWLHWF